MTMDSSFLGAICEVIPLSKDNSPLRSPDILRRETRVGVSKFGLEYVAGLVNSTLQDQIGRISEHRLGSDKFYDRLTKKGTSHEYTDLNPKTLLRMAGSYVRKSQLRDKNDDHSRLSAVEAHELEGLYEFLKTEDGKVLLQRGIVEAMGLSITGERDSHTENMATNLERCVQKINAVASASEAIRSSANKYLRSIRQILIQHYTAEWLILADNALICRKMLSRKVLSGSNNNISTLADNINTFEKSLHSSLRRIAILLKEQATDNTKTNNEKQNQ